MTDYRYLLIWHNIFSTLLDNALFFNCSHTVHGFKKQLATEFGGSELKPNADLSDTANLEARMAKVKFFLQSIKIINKHFINTNGKHRRQTQLQETFRSFPLLDLQTKAAIKSKVEVRLVFTSIYTGSWIG